MMDNVDSVLRRLRQYLKRRGGVEGKSGTVMEMTIVWATAILWTMDWKKFDGRN